MTEQAEALLINRARAKGHMQLLVHERQGIGVAWIDRVLEPETAIGAMALEWV